MVELDVAIEGAVVPGQVAAFVVRVTTPRRLRPRGVVLTIECTLVLDGGAERRFAIDRLEQPAPAEGAGAAVFQLAWPVPAGLPPSGARIRYQARASADVTGWPDPERVTPVVVVAPGSLPARAAEPLRLEAVAASGAACKCELDVATLVAGETVGARIVCARGGSGRLRLELRGVLDLHTPGEKARATSLVVVVAECRVSNMRALEPEALELEVPAHALPDFVAPCASFEWWLSWRLQLGAEVWTSVQRLPLLSPEVPTYALPVTPARRRSTAARRPIRDGALRAAWREVARDHGFDFDDEQLTGRIAGALVKVRRIFHDGGWWLVGDLEYASLELGLEIRRRSRERAPEAHSLQLGDLPGPLDVVTSAKAWDRRHRLSAPDPEQVGGFVAALRPAILPLEVTRLDDTRVRLLRPDDARALGSPIRLVVIDLVKVAMAVRDARAEITCPRLARHVLPAWRSLAERLEGTLRVAVLAIDGSFGGLPAQVETRWSAGRVPAETLVRLVPGDGAALEQVLPAPLADPEEALAALARLVQQHHAARTVGGAYR